MKNLAEKLQIEHSSNRLTVGEQEDYIGYNLCELYFMYVNLLTLKTQSRLMSLNLTQWRTLTLIRYNPDQTQFTLAKSVGVNPSSMTPIIDLLEDRLLVRRHKSKTNRSAYNIRMTNSGVKAYNKINLEIKKMEEWIISILGDEESGEFNQALSKLRDRLEVKLQP